MQSNNNLIMDNNNNNDDEGYTADDIFNNTFKNIKSVNYDQKNDIWIVDLNFKNIYEMSYPDINDNVDKNNTNFPSFKRSFKISSLDKRQISRSIDLKALPLVLKILFLFAEYCSKARFK